MQLLTEDLRVSHRQVRLDPGVGTRLLRHVFGPQRGSAHQWVALLEPDVIATLVYVKSTGHTCHRSPTPPDSVFPGGCSLAYY